MIPSLEDYLSDLECSCAPPKTCPICQIQAHLSEFRQARQIAVDAWEKAKALAEEHDLLPDSWIEL